MEFLSQSLQPLVADDGQQNVRSNLQKINVSDVINKPDVIRGGSRTPKTSKTRSL